MGNRYRDAGPGGAGRLLLQVARLAVVHDERGVTILKPPQDFVFMVFQLAEDYVMAPVWPPAPVSSAR